MPSMQPTSWPMTSGRSGLPKLRQLVIAKRAGAHGHQVAPRLGHRLTAAHHGIGEAVARGAVGGERERAVGAVDADDGGIPARPLHGVGHDHVVVLLPDPALAGEVGRAQQLQQRFTVGQHGLAVAGRQRHAAAASASAGRS